MLQLDTEAGNSSQATQVGRSALPKMGQLITLELPNGEAGGAVVGSITDPDPHPQKAKN